MLLPDLHVARIPPDTMARRARQGRGMTVAISEDEFANINREMNKLEMNAARRVLHVLDSVSGRDMQGRAVLVGTPAMQFMFESMTRTRTPNSLDLHSPRMLDMLARVGSGRIVHQELGASLE